MGIIVAIANQKGGVGKTTTAVTLAHGLAIQGRTVLLVDLDPQGQCATALGREQEPGVANLLMEDVRLQDVLRTTGRDRLTLLPGNKRTSRALTILIAEGTYRIDLVKRIVAQTIYDWVVIDTAPTVGGLQEAAVFAADLVLVPVAADFLSAQAVQRTAETLKVLKTQHSWRGGLFGILPTFFDGQTNESQAILDDLRKSFGALVLPEIHRATVLRECVAAGRTIWEMSPKCRTAQEYARIVWRLSA
jgi:chromosome partitioning protein